MPARHVPDRTAGGGQASHLAWANTRFSRWWRTGLHRSSERLTPSSVRLFVEPQGVGLLHLDRVVLQEALLLHGVRSEHRQAFARDTCIA